MRFLTSLQGVKPLLKCDHSSVNIGHLVELDGLALADQKLWHG